MAANTLFAFCVILLLFLSLTSKLDDIPRLGRSGGGVAIIAKKGFDTKILDDSRSFHSFEYLDAVVGIGNKYIRLVTVYRPPPLKENNTSTGMFFEEFSLLLEELVISTSPLLIFGDFNIHMDDGLNTNTNNFKDLLTSVGLMKNVCNSTHKRGHILDLLITSCR